MSASQPPRRSIWTWGLQSDEPTDAQRAEYAKNLAQQLGVALTPPPIPRPQDLALRAPRISPPASIAPFCRADAYERAAHSYGADKERAVFGEFPNPPDVVAYPATDEELEACLEWCSNGGYATIPYGGGSSVVEGVTPAGGATTAS